MKEPRPIDKFLEWEEPAKNVQFMGYLEQTQASQRLKSQDRKKNMNGNISGKFRYTEMLRNLKKN